MKSLETGWVGHWGPLPLWWRLWEWIPPAICNNSRRDLNTKSIITVRTSNWLRCCWVVQDSVVCLIISCFHLFLIFYLGCWFQNAYSLSKGQDASHFYVVSRLCSICVIYYGEFVIKVSRCHWNEEQEASPFVEMNWNIEIICSYVTSVS